MPKSNNLKNNLLLKIHNKSIPVLEIYGFMSNNTQRFFDIININQKLFKFLDLSITDNNKYDYQTNLIYSKFKLYQTVVIELIKKSKLTNITQLNESNKISELITSYQKYSKEKLSSIKKEFFDFISKFIEPKTISDNEKQTFDLQLYKFYFQKNLNNSMTLLYTPLKISITKIDKIDDYKKKLILLDDGFYLTNANKIQKNGKNILFADLEKLKTSYESLIKDINNEKLNPNDLKNSIKNLLSIKNNLNDFLHKKIINDDLIFQNLSEIKLPQNNNILKTLNLYKNELLRDLFKGITMPKYITCSGEIYYPQEAIELFNENGIQIENDNNEYNEKFPFKDGCTKYNFFARINLLNGKVDNWENKGVSCKIWVRVKDEGYYGIEDEDKNNIKELQGYVPNFFNISHLHCSDEICFDVDVKGNVLKFEERNIKELVIEELIEEENDNYYI